MKEDRVIRKKAKNPGTGKGINPKEGKGRNHHTRLDIIKEMGEVKK